MKFFIRKKKIKIRGIFSNKIKFRDQHKINSKIEDDDIIYLKFDCAYALSKI